MLLLGGVDAGGGGLRLLVEVDMLLLVEDGKTSRAEPRPVD
jgi:hypothetical protein